MKRIEKRRRYQIRYAYPNEADRTYQTRRLVDTVTALVSGIGLIAAMLFLVLFI